jgi:hypothetical protein
MAEIQATSTRSRSRQDWGIPGMCWLRCAQTSLYPKRGLPMRFGDIKKLEGMI